MSEALVNIQSLSKVFSPQFPPALSDINAVFPEGKIVGLVGPDGAGKTTLIRTMAGLLLPTEGKVTIAGHDTIKDAEYIHLQTSYMPQKFGLYEDLTVIQNLTLYADLRGVMGIERAQTFEKLLDFTGLKPFTDRLAKNLSGGMKQKLGLACALIKKPLLLLLDEPSVGVDPISRRELWKMIKNLLGEGISIVWSTAYLDEAQRCDTVLLLNEGKAMYFGPPQALTDRVDQRVVKLTRISTNKRKILTQALQEKGVIDGVIQGKDVRLVLKEKKTPITVSDPAVKQEIVAPRFEDAFIEILGGGPKGKSKLAELRPQLEKKSENAVVVDHLTKKFGDFVAADHITCAVKRGEIFGLLGPNGAGKSTTFKMMCGLLKPTEGKAYVNDLDLQIAGGEARSHIGYMAQKFSLYGNLSVQQNLNFFSGIYNLKGKEKREAIQRAIEIFSLKPYLNSSADLLPLGFKQRLSLACATLHQPEILFLDEPTSGVDPIIRREFWNHINGLVEKGVTILVTTHFMDEAEYCDRIALIYKGKIINIDSPDVLKEKAKTDKIPNPTLEDAFIQLIEEYDRNSLSNS